MSGRGPVQEGALQVRFWGVRGSITASGPDFVAFGGHTPCVEVRCGGRLFVIDAGSGIAALGAALGDAAPDEVDVLLSHLHLDHVGGLPFFKPATLGAASSGRGAATSADAAPKRPSTGSTRRRCFRSTSTICRRASSTSGSRPARRCASPAGMSSPRIR